MALAANELYVSVGRGTIETPERITREGYIPPTAERGYVVTVRNASSQDIEWLTVDVALFHKGVKRSYGYDYDSSNPYKVHRIERLTGVEVLPTHYQYRLAAGATVEMPVRSRVWGFDDSAQSARVLRVYGRAAGAEFVHHYASGYLAPLKSTTEIEDKHCFIATAAFADTDHPVVQELRVVRDEVLRRFTIGRRFVDWYYKNSPAAAAYVETRPSLRTAARAVLTPIALTSRGARRTTQAIMRTKRGICQLYRNML